jgi:hypothetical protein
MLTFRATKDRGPRTERRRVTRVRIEFMSRPFVPINYLLDCVI